MNEKQIDFLIEVLFDKTAREDEKDDAAIDLGLFNDMKASEALVAYAIDPKQNPSIMDVCGESIARIWANQNFFDLTTFLKLHPTAQYEAAQFFKIHKPEWFKLIN